VAQRAGGAGPRRGAASVSRKAVIARSFDAAAPTYDAHAAVQREVARRLACRIAARDLPPAPRVLEIGCGTGLMSEALLERVPGARCVLTDLAPAMVRRCRDKLRPRQEQTCFAVMDGEAPAVAGGFDLVVSSFAFQWFLELDAAAEGLARCLKPGGRLVFTTLGAGTFSEWRAAHAALGLPYNGLILPAADELADRLCGAADQDGRRTLRGAVEEERILRRYADGPAFLHELKALGADVPAALAPPLGPGRLRRLLRGLEGADGAGFAITYHVLYGSFARAPGVSEDAPRLCAAPRAAAAG
jgi:malonyl-CoA O-methyltransferase